MNLVDFVFCKAIARKRKGFTTEHAKILNCLIENKEMFLDEIAQELELEERKAKKILDELARKKIIRKHLIKYCLDDPFEALHKIV